MQKNKQALLGFASLLGLLGIFTDNRYYLGFFGFLVFFQYLWVVPDELFWSNVRRAGSTAFFSGLCCECLLTVGLLCAFDVNRAAIVACGVGTALSLVVFTLLLSHYEQEERRGMADED